MIEYNYTMDKNDGYETKQFKPNFDTTISNVVTFRGHNSSGKSTFMDLVALSLYGRDSPEVISKLKDKLDYLKEGARSDFDFTMKADNGNLILRVHSKKNGFIEGCGSFESIVEESSDGGITFRELTKEKFRKQYRVIYDMPDRPMERVQELVREAERITRQTRDSIDSFRYSLNEELMKAENSRNEDVIYMLRNEIESKTSLVNSICDDVDQVRKMSKKLNQLYYSSELSQLIDERENIEQKIRNLNEDHSKKQRETKKEFKVYDENLRSIKRQLKIMIDGYRSACNKIEQIGALSDDDIQKYKQFNTLSPESILRFGCSQLFDFRKITSDLIQKIESKTTDSEAAALSEKKKLLGELVTALEPYTNDSIEVLNSPISTLYDQLSCELKEIQSRVSAYESTQDVLASMRSASEAAKKADIEYAELGDRPNEPDDVSSGIAAGLNARRESVSSRIKNVSEKAIQYGVSAETTTQLYESLQDDILLRDYLKLSLEELQQKAEELAGGVCHKETTIMSLKARIQKLQGDLKDAESKEAHPLSEYKDELKQLKQTIESTIKNLDHKDSMLDVLATGETVPESEDNKGFLEQVWIYLGKRLGTIQHIGQSYAIKKIDMNQRAIITETAKIMFKDMGTGESQLAYLTGLLNSDDDRITIALFDEVDHMDPVIISKIQHQLRELYFEGKLLMGIMAAPGNGTEVVPCE